MKSAYQNYQKRWNGKPIFCSIRMAAVLLDMDACKVFFEPVPDNARTEDRQRIIHDIVPNIAFKEEADRVNLGFYPNVPNKFIRGPEEFGIFQGLVWELIVPMNPANLPDSPFKSFLGKSDILDFPGVGNEQAGKATKIDLEAIPGDAGWQNPNAHGEEATDGKSKGIPFESKYFFLQILKRGKTSSIVSTYAKRLTIDGFNIFQNIDGYPPVNGHQLITGINTWWKHIAPDYYTNQEGKSPLPLNLCICWWARIINEAPVNTATILGNKENVYKALGKIASPEVSTSFSLNYYNFDRGEVRKTFEPDSKIYQIIKSEDAFIRQFQSVLSIKSFEHMVQDKETGGTNFFFSVLSDQIDEAQSESGSKRSTILGVMVEDANTDLKSLLNSHDIFPPPKIRDARKEDLKELRQRLGAAIAQKTDKEMEEINHALREFLDINFQMLLPIPSDPMDVDKSLIRSQYRQWINGQIHRFREWEINPAPHDPNWTLIGVDTSDACRNYLNALSASMEPALEAMTLSLRRLCEFRKTRFNLSNIDLRRHLAIIMANALVHSYCRDGSNIEFNEEEEDYLALDATDKLGRDCYFYTVFIKPFLEEQLPALSGLSLKAVNRPDDIPGEDELVALCNQYEMAPDSSGENGKEGI